MINFQVDLAEDLIRRFKAGKANAALLRISDKPYIYTENKRFEAIEYLIRLENDAGEKINLIGGTMLTHPNITEEYTLLIDNKGIQGDFVRYTLFKGDDIIASSLNTVAGYVYIGIKLENSDKPFVMSFAIVQDEKEKCSSFVSDGAPNVFQLCRYSAMLFRGNI